MKMPLTATTGRRALEAAVVAVLVLGVSACGGGKSTTTNAASATEQWAGGVCSAFTTWKKSLQDIGTTLKNGGVSSLSSSELKKAANQADDATKTLVQSLKDLGVPETAQSQTAKKSLTTLENSLTQSLDSIQSAVSSGGSSLAGVATTVATITTEVEKMGTSLSTAATDLKGLNPGSDLEKAFKQAPSCSAYVSS